MTTATLTLPTPDATGRLLTDLLGKGVTAKKVPAYTPGPKDCAAIAIYAADDKVPRAICACDAALSCSAGAALTMLPAAMAAQCARTGKIPENILENLKEILNIATQLFQSPTAGHVKLQEVVIAPAKLAPEVAALLAKPAARLDLELTIQSYGPGKMALLVS